MFNLRRRCQNSEIHKQLPCLKKVRMTFSSSRHPMKMAEVAPASVLATTVAASCGILSNNQIPTPAGKSGRRGCQDPHFQESHSCRRVAPPRMKIHPIPPLKGSCEKIQNSGKTPCEGTRPTHIPKVLRQLCGPGPRTRRIFSQLQGHGGEG